MEVVLIGASDVMVERSTGREDEVERLALERLEEEAARSGGAQAGRELEPVQHPVLIALSNRVTQYITRVR